VREGLGVRLKIVFKFESDKPLFFEYQDQVMLHYDLFLTRDLVAIVTLAFWCVKSK
jgi:hypothetical protein